MSSNSGVRFEITTPKTEGAGPPRVRLRGRRKGRAETQHLNLFWFPMSQNTARVMAQTMADWFDDVTEAEALVLIDRAHHALVSAGLIGTAGEGRETRRRAGIERHAGAHSS
jgi:sulfate adenylyltransferase subunit 1 (EFTu-like GTPase family)